MVIARIWHGATQKPRSAEYLTYLKRTGMKDYAGTTGNLVAKILVQDGVEKTEFLIISFWKSKTAIKKFAGDDIEKARYYPKDREFLLELEPNVKHYNVAFES